MSEIISEPLEFYELALGDIFAIDLYRVENLGCCSRLIFVTKKQKSDGSGAFLEASCSVVVPNDRLPAIALLLNKPPVSIENEAAVAGVTLN